MIFVYIGLGAMTAYALGAWVVSTHERWVAKRDPAKSWLR